MLTLHRPNHTTQPIWYYKDDNDEFEMYGFEEKTDLETKWQNFMNSKGDPYEGITCGYFANCADRHIVDFIHLMQHNVDLNESRSIIRALSNHQINDNYIKIAVNKIKVQNTELHPHAPIATKYDALKRNLQHEEDCGGDAVTIHIPSIVNEIVNDTLYSHSQQHDIPICVAKISMDSHAKYKRIDRFVDSFARVCDEMDIIKLHSMHLRVSSSMISYLIAQQKCNFILYDAAFELLAVGFYTGDYVHNYERTEDCVNPYHYQSLVDFYSLFTSFCELSLSDGLIVESLVSSFNKNMRVCVEYDEDNECALWTQSIANRQKFKQILRTTPHQTQNTASVSVSESDSDDSEDEIECSVCYKPIYSNPSECFDHNDLCHSCVLHWKQSGHDSCPKCGIAHVKSY